MANYTIRIELHGANYSHYVDLAKKLAAIGVVDTIRADDGTLYKLPPAEYNHESTADINSVEQACAGIAASVVPSYAVLVSQAVLRRWRGLQVVR